MTAQVQRTDVTKWVITVDQKGTGQITLADLRAFLLATDDLPDTVKVHHQGSLPPSSEDYPLSECGWTLHAKHEGVSGAEES